MTFLLMTFEGAEQAAADDGMISGPLDLSYMGVYTIWNNLLGLSCLGCTQQS
jgi:hypothetical protein